MLAFVLNGDVTGAISGVEANVRGLFSDLGMDAPGVLLPSTIRPNDARVRETRHGRANHSEPFVIHHLFMAGDPNAPLRPSPPPSTKPAKRKPKSTTRASRN